MIIWTKEKKKRKEEDKKKRRKREAKSKPTRLSHQHRRATQTILAKFSSSTSLYSLLMNVCTGGNAYLKHRGG